jgi:light-regulated signal transduction histidine kinase (bacteriophytochrome)
MSQRQQQVDLTNCDREPIHQPGAIQPFGALIAVTSDWIVNRRSANAAEVLGIDAAFAPGQPLADMFSPEAMDRMRRRLDRTGNAQEDAVERIFGIRLAEGGALFDVALHVAGGLTILEFEPHSADDFADHVGSLRPITARLDRLDDMSELADEAARQMKRLLGFDRVMVYRFHPDLSGEVIAEAREPHLESFHGLRYPATDIPAQARTLYLRNRFRIISDVAAEPVPVEPVVSLGGEHLDLSMSTLRSVSPIHIEYLRNMGVAASLSISIVIDGKLWGLFACHHYAPRVLPYSLRTVAELFSELFSLTLDRVLLRKGTRLAGIGRDLHDRLMARLAGGTGLAENLATLGGVIEHAIPHDGASAYVDGIYTARGHAPSEAEFLAIVPSLNTGATSTVFAAEALADNLPAAAAFAERAAGALIIPVSRRPRDYFVLWRRALPQTVLWAGNPEKPVETGPNGPRLTPRKSFEAWQQSVDGRSAAWGEDERRIAESIRITLIEVVLKLTDDAVRERTRAQDQQDLLIAELNHRVRNILNLIRSLINQSRHDAVDVGAFSELVGGRIDALAKAHDNITRENWSPASVRHLIDVEAEAYLGGKHDRVVITGADWLVAPEAYTVLALVLHEMMTNSVKYGALCDRHGRLEIALDRTDDGDLRIEWRERDGPPVRPPERRGFGSTIIDQSIPHELKGESHIRYKLSGVEADFIIPGRFAERTDSAEPHYATPGPAPTSTHLDAPLAHVLVVEDSMIIAMDTEETLRLLGVETVTTASSVSAALKSIANDPPQFAILDYNLGTETSDPVARHLAEHSIPFVFATGYGENARELREKGAQGVLMKPYAKSDIASALGIG